MHTLLRTDTMRIPVIDGELDTTVAIPAPWLLPPVTATYRRPSPTLAHRWHRVRTSQFADDIHDGVHRGLAVMGAFGVAIAFVILVRGAYVAAEIVGVAR